MLRGFVSAAIPIGSGRRSSLDAMTAALRRCDENSSAKIFITDLSLVRPEQFNLHSQKMIWIKSRASLGSESRPFFGPFDDRNTGRLIKIFLKTRVDDFALALESVKVQMEQRPA